MRYIYYDNDAFEAQLQKEDVLVYEFFDMGVPKRENDIAYGTSTPGKWHAFTDRDEFCTIVSGHCRLISVTGEVQDYRSGDAFLIPNGFRGYWEVVETTTKHFVIRHY